MIINESKLSLAKCRKEVYTYLDLWSAYDIIETYFKKGNPLRYSYEILKLGDLIDLLHLLHVAEDLEVWQSMFPIEGCTYIHWGIDKENRLIPYPDQLSYALDGYSQCKYTLEGSAIPDSQCFMGGSFINLFLADLSGGVVTRINKETGKIRYYAIGEDDGHWFITREWWIKNLPLWKTWILSEVNEFRVSGIDHQMIVEKILTTPMVPEIKYVL